MKFSDYIGLGFLLAFGLWWIAFPATVLGLYNWLLKGHVKLPGTQGVRLAGVLWVLLVAIVIIATFRKR